VAGEGPAMAQRSWLSFGRINLSFQMRGLENIAHSPYRYLEQSHQRCSLGTRECADY